MSDILDEAYGVVQCKECPWYKACVIPMKITAEDIRRQLESSTTGAEPGQPIDFNTELYPRRLSGFYRTSAFQPRTCPANKETDAGMGERDKRKD